MGDKSQGCAEPPAAYKEALTAAKAPALQPEEDLTTLSGLLAYIRRWGDVIISTCTKADCKASLTALADKAKDIVTTAVQFLRDFPESALEEQNKGAIEEIVGRHTMKEETVAPSTVNLIFRNLLSAALLKHPREVAKWCMDCKHINDPRYPYEELQKMAESAFQLFLRFEISSVRVDGKKFSLQTRKTHAFDYLEILDVLLVQYRGKTMMVDILEPRYGDKFRVVGEDMRVTVGLESTIYLDENGNEIDELAEERAEMAEEARAKAVQAKREEDAKRKQLPLSRPSSAAAGQQRRTGGASMAAGSGHRSSSSVCAGPSKHKSAEITSKHTRDAFNLPAARLPRHQMHSNLANKRPNMPKGLPRAAVTAAAKKGLKQKPSPTKARDASSRPVTPQSRCKPTYSTDDCSDEEICPATNPHKNGSRPTGEQLNSPRQLRYPPILGAASDVHAQLDDDWQWTDEEEAQVEEEPPRAPITWMVNAAVRRPQPPRGLQPWAGKPGRPASMRNLPAAPAPEPRRPAARQLLNALGTSTQQRPGAPIMPHADAFAQLAQPDIMEVPVALSSVCLASAQVPAMAAASNLDKAQPVVSGSHGIGPTLPLGTIRPPADAFFSPPRMPREGFFVPDTPATAQNESTLYISDQEADKGHVEGCVQSALRDQAPGPSSAADQSGMHQEDTEAAKPQAGQAAQQPDVSMGKSPAKPLQEQSTAGATQSAHHQECSPKPCKSSQPAKENAALPWPAQPAADVIKPAGPIPQRKQPRKTTGGRTLKLQHLTQPQPEKAIFCRAQGAWISTAPSAAPAPPPSSQCNDQQDEFAPSETSDRLPQPAAQPALAAGRATADKAPCSSEVPIITTRAGSKRQAGIAVSQPVDTSVAPPTRRRAAAWPPQSGGIVPGQQATMDIKPCGMRARRKPLPSIGKDPGDGPPEAGEPLPAAPSAAPASAPSADLAPATTATRTRDAGKKPAAPVATRAPSARASNKRKADAPAERPPEAAKRSNSLPCKTPAVASTSGSQLPAIGSAPPSSGQRKSARLAVAKRVPSADRQVGATPAGPSNARRNTVGSKRDRDGRAEDPQAKAPAVREGKAHLPRIEEDGPLEDPAPGCQASVIAEPANPPSASAPHPMVEGKTGTRARRGVRQTPTTATVQAEPTRRLPARAARARKAVETPPTDPSEETAAKANPFDAGRSQQAPAAFAQPAVKQAQKAKGKAGEKIAEIPAAPAANTTAAPNSKVGLASKFVSKGAAANGKPACGHSCLKRSARIAVAGKLSTLGELTEQRQDGKRVPSAKRKMGSTSTEPSNASKDHAGGTAATRSRRGREERCQEPQAKRGRKAILPSSGKPEPVNQEAGASTAQVLPTDLRRIALGLRPKVADHHAKPVSMQQPKESETAVPQQGAAKAPKATTSKARKSMAAGHGGAAVAAEAKQKLQRPSAQRSAPEAAKRSRQESEPAIMDNTGVAEDAGTTLRRSGRGQAHLKTWWMVNAKGV